MDENGKVKIRAQNIQKAYLNAKTKESVCVLDSINLDVHETEFIVILGPSGSGKSTLCKILGGVIPATSGSIIVDGIDHGTQLPARLLNNFGFVFQNNNLLQWRTAAGNLKFMLETMHLKGDAWQNRIREMLEIVGLQDYQDVYPHELSGGMKQRVGIARALVHDPDILIMDQPLGALDAITRRVLTFEILNIWQKTRKTVVMVTNNVDEALILGNRVFVFSNMPARIMYEMHVDIPVEERDEQLVFTEHFLELRAELNKYVRSALIAEVKID